MTNPIVWYKDQAEASEADPVNLDSLPDQSKIPVKSNSGKEEVFEYVATLGSRKSGGSNPGEDSGEMFTSLAAIELVCRTSPKGETLDILWLRLPS